MSAPPASRGTAPVPASRSDGGFILLAALWLLVALAGVGVHGALRMQTERLAAANALDEARAREAALAGTEYARSRLTAAVLDREAELRAEGQARALAGGRTPEQGRSRRDRRSLTRAPDPSLDPWRDPHELMASTLAFGDAAFELRLRDLSAALNLNLSDEGTIRAFFSQGLELDYAQADRITQAILDWRDEDDLPRIGGAEREEYLRSGLAVLPPNRPMVSVDELRHVFGVTPEIMEAARPYLTVIPFSRRINVNSAPLPVLRALPGVDAAGAEELLRLRDAGVLPGSMEALLAVLPAPTAGAIQAVREEFDRMVTFSTTALEVEARGWVEGGVVDTLIRTVVTRTDQGAQVVWRELP